MKARVGDRLVRDAGDARRVCEIIGLHHADGSPPYVVRWLSDGHIALLYPGPYTRLVHRGAGQTGGQDASEPAASKAADGQPASDRAARKPRPARASQPGRRWAGNPFLPRTAAPWPGGAL